MITSREGDVPRVGVLWRGDRRADAPLPRADRGLGPLYDAFAALPGVTAETQWVPQMIGILGLDLRDLPVIWDADFLYGPKTAAGDDTYVLCEINVSAVWPFPPMAAPAVAAATLRCLAEAGH